MREGESVVRLAFNSHVCVRVGGWVRERQRESQREMEDLSLSLSLSLSRARARSLSVCLSLSLCLSVSLSLSLSLTTAVPLTSSLHSCGHLPRSSSSPCTYTHIQRYEEHIYSSSGHLPSSSSSPCTYTHTYKTHTQAPNTHNKHTLAPTHINILKTQIIGGRSPDYLTAGRG